MNWKHRDFSHLSAGWQQAVQMFLKSIENMSGSQSTLRVYTSVLLRFCAQHPDPGTVTKSDILEFMQAPSVGRRRNGGETRGATKASKKSILKSFYEFCSDFEYEGKILFDHSLPTAGIKSIKRDVMHHTLAAPELERFFDVITSSGTTTLKALRDYSLFATYLYTTRRRSELANLKWGDISEDTIIDKDGSTRPGYVFRFEMKGKGRSLNRQELPEPCMVAICTYLEAAGRLATIQPGDYIWTAILGGQGRTDGTSGGPLNVNYISREFRRFMELANFPPEASHLHVLRHSGARLRWSEGQELMSLKETLGHSRLDTTQIYVGNISGVSDPMARKLQYGPLAFLSRR